MKLPHIPHVTMPKCAFCCAQGPGEATDAVTLVNGTAVCHEHAEHALLVLAPNVRSS